MLKLKLSTIDESYEVEAGAIDEARRRTQEFIDERELLASTFSQAEVYTDSGERVGEIAYNNYFIPDNAGTLVELLRRDVRPLAEAMNMQGLDVWRLIDDLTFKGSDLQIIKDRYGLSHKTICKIFLGIE